MPVDAGATRFSIALAATLRRACVRRAAAGPGRDGPRVLRADLCRKVSPRTDERLTVVVVDASESMGKGLAARMAVARGTVLGILRAAYRGRHRVALVAVGGHESRVVLGPSRSVDLGCERLLALGTGGATPLAHGLVQAGRMIRAERARRPWCTPLLIVVSDGEANVSLTPGVPPEQEIEQLADVMRRDGIGGVMIDVAHAGQESAMLRLAARMGLPYHRVG